MLAIQPEHNFSACGGPMKCRYCAELLTEDGARGHARIKAENAARGLRTACEKPRDYSSPDPYAAGIKKLRKELPSTRQWPTPPTPSSSQPSATPPDPYAKGIAAMKKDSK